MALLQGIDKEIADKWDIDPAKYRPWVKTEKVFEVLDKYREKAGIKSANGLAKIMGIAPQSLYQARRRGGKMMMFYASKWLDSINIDPRIVLEPKNSELDADTIDPMTELFLEVFSTNKERALMVKYKNELRVLINKLEAAQAKLKEEQASQAV